MARGGSAAVARALSTPERQVRKSTVHSWITNGNIPDWRIDAVMALPVVEQSPTAEPQQDAAA